MHGRNDLLTGWENVNLVRWYPGAFRNEMVLAYNPKTGFTAHGDTELCPQGCTPY
jgi:hypothetical protein